MIHWLHTFHPDRVLLSLGPVSIYWYGFFYAVGIGLAIWLAVSLGKKYGLKQDELFDCFFWLIIFGLLGARLYHVLINWSYYGQHLTEIIMIWKGGMAIHGGIIAGVLTGWYFTKKHKIDFWKLSSVVVPGLVLAQALGRWGNYFNQELFGRPTNLAWGIPIDLMHRPIEFFSADYFQPLFLYESLGNLLICIILLLIHWYILKHKQNKLIYFYQSRLCTCLCILLCVLVWSYYVLIRR
jgi:phosphatidylglycerol:prolipoprotein diacylglycerol transferase